MFSRLGFVAITVFFLTMNVFLWRSEFVGGSKVGGPVPFETVWRKLATAPDDSTLEIRQRGKKIGYCRWVPNIGEAVGTEKRMEELPPEGMVKEVTGYTLDLDGNFTAQEGRQVRFNLGTRLDTNHLWQTFQLRVFARPAAYGIQADAARQLITLSHEEDGQTNEQTLTFAQARDPGKLIEDLGGPLLGRLWKSLGIPFPLSSNPSTAPDLGLKWEARHDWMTVGRSRFRIYRLQARLFDRFECVVLVSHVGEVLRIELPDSIVLVNDGLVNL